MADEVFLTNDVREAQHALSLPTTDEEYKTERILGRSFDPADPDPWIERDVALADLQRK